MSSFRDEFSLNLALEDAKAACRNAANEPGWRLIRQTDTILIVDEAPAQTLTFTSPVRVEITLNDSSWGSTVVWLKSRNFGFGPLQSRHAKERTQALKQGIERAASEARAGAKVPQVGGARAVFINSERLSDAEVQNAVEAYQMRLDDGRYWYDRGTGAWGIEGGPTAGFLLPELPFGGFLRADASNGDTGVFINGRELHRQDVAALRQFVPIVLRGRYWMNAQGSFGYEGGPMLGNVWLLAQARDAPHGGAWSRHSSVTGMTVGGDGQGFVYAMGKDALGNSFDVSIG